MGFAGKIALGIPHAGQIPGYFFDTVLNLSRPSGTSVIRVENKPIDLARNMIVEAALADPEITHLFFMDADMQFPAEALLRLVQDDRPVVAGTYFARGGTPTPHAFAFHHQDDPDGSCPEGITHGGDFGRWYRPLGREFADYLKAHPEYADEPGAVVLPATPDALVECDALATGAMLIRREVLEAVRQAHPEDPLPWFKCHERSAGGEDFYFCEQARAAGYSVWIDFAVQCSHEFRYVWLNRGDFASRFRVGEADEHNFDVLVDASPGRPQLAARPQLLHALESEAS